jgi:hypothetical protein
MRRHHKGFAASPIESLEDRLAPSHLPIHPAAAVGRHHIAAVDGHIRARGAHHHVHRPRHDHAGPVAPVIAPGPIGPASGSTAGGSGSTATGPGSTATGPGPASGGAGSTAATVALTGTVHGGTTLAGSGTISPLGSVTSSGMLKTSGAEPVVYTGDITLVGATGSITASLSGRLFGPNRLGETIDLTYTITGGTGAFQGATGSGQAFFTPTSFDVSGGFSLTFGNPPAMPA